MFSIGGLFSALPYILIGFVGLMAYDRFIDDPAVARKARQGYVDQVKYAALEAQRDEIQRQADVALKVAAEFQAKLLVEQQTNDEELARAENAIERYEKQLAQEGRSCKLSDSDLKFLR